MFLAQVVRSCCRRRIVRAGRGLHDGQSHLSGGRRIAEGKTAALASALALTLSLQRLLGRSKRSLESAAIRIALRPRAPCYAINFVFLPPPNIDTETSQAPIPAINSAYCCSSRSSIPHPSQASNIHPVCYNVCVSLPLPNSIPFAPSPSRVTLDP
ncbi:hypothetical protein D6D06_01478 [Aureobasidium pullulans]|nr:hypothetical protein D6D06_01478 [Aureobasidium pullulans]